MDGSFVGLHDPCINSKPAAFSPHGRSSFVTCNSAVAAPSVEVKPQFLSRDLSISSQKQYLTRNRMADTSGAAEGHEHTNGTSSKPGAPHGKDGWDGKLRVNKQATLANPEALSDPEYSDEDAPPVDQIAADEGVYERYTTIMAESMLTMYRLA